MKVNKKFSFFTLLLCSLFLFTASTCSQKTITEEPNKDLLGCIDSAKINKEGICPANYDPVCGCDNVTYSNECMAEISGVLRYTRGECGTCIDGSKIMQTPCTKEYRPVCGCNGITYGNECMARNAGVIKWTAGNCEEANGSIKNKLPKDCFDPKKIRLHPCTEEYAPVCGCDGKTYSNACKASNDGIQKWVDGKCK